MEEDDERPEWEVRRDELGKVVRVYEEDGRFARMSSEDAVFKKDDHPDGVLDDDEDVSWVSEYDHLREIPTVRMCEAWTITEAVEVHGDIEQSDLRMAISECIVRKTAWKKIYGNMMEWKELVDEEYGIMVAMHTEFSKQMFRMRTKVTDSFAVMTACNS
jgi:hypothetical protein